MLMRQLGAKDIALFYMDFLLNYAVITRISFWMQSSKS